MAETGRTLLQPPYTFAAAPGADRAPRPAERGQDPVLSLIFPVYNEEEVLPRLIARLDSVLSDLASFEDGLLDGRVEVIFVNDGSRDRSEALLEELSIGRPWVKLVAFSRNFGHQTAVTAGVDHARGDAVVIMDADLQDPPELLPQMLTLWREGYEVVYCVRRKRKEGVVKRFCYAAFYRLLQAVSSINIPLDSGDFCLMDRKVVSVLQTMPERNRYLRGLRAWIGFKQTALEYERAAREAGESKYDIKRLFKLAADGIFSFSYAPLQLAGSLGVLVALAGVLYALKVIVWKLLGWDEVPGFASLAVITLMLGGIQLLTLYFMGTYIGRIYDESKQRPLYIVRRRLGFEAGAGSAERGNGRASGRRVVRRRVRRRVADASAAASQNGRASR